MKKSLAIMTLTALASACAALSTHAATPAGSTSLYDQLEQEKQVYNVYKAYFPSAEIARKAAEESFVLLKNDKHTLPLAATAKERVLLQSHTRKKT